MPPPCFKPRSEHAVESQVVVPGITLEGYNIVGDGTPQALIPILTGRTELELPETRKRMGEKASFVNVYPFVWKDYQANGYVTGDYNIINTGRMFQESRVLARITSNFLVQLSI